LSPGFTPLENRDPVTTLGRLFTTVTVSLVLILFEFGDLPMMRKLLLGVKRRAERFAASEPSPIHSAHAVSAR
jgi:hypothetical protein